MNNQSSRYIDLSHIVEAGMVTYPGLPAPVVGDFLSREASRAHYAPGTEFHIGRVEMVANTGTYVDAPYHRFAGGRDLAQLPLASLANLAGVVVRPAGDDRAVAATTFAGLELAGKAVLVQTGWSAHWGNEQYFHDHPFLTAAAARFLVAGGARLVGIDSLNIDDTADAERPAHTILLAADIPIVEHLTNLNSLPPAGFRFSAVPAPFKGLGSFPVRAYAVVE